MMEQNLLVPVSFPISDEKIFDQITDSLLPKLLYLLKAHMGHTVHQEVSLQGDGVSVRLLLS